MRINYLLLFHVSFLSYRSQRDLLCKKKKKKKKEKRKEREREKKKHAVNIYNIGCYCILERSRVLARNILYLPAKLPFLSVVALGAEVLAATPK
jgi:hypothetical protein